MRTLKRTYLRSARILAAVLLIFLIVGSFADLPVSKLLYPGHETSFGQFFAAFGELPAFLCLTSAGVLLIRNRSRLPGGKALLWAGAGAALVLLGLVLAVHEAVDNVPALPVWVALLVAVFTAAASGLALLLLTAYTPARTVLRFALTLVFVSVGTMALVNIIKIPWGRARMRFIVETGNETYFTPWWKAGSALKTKLVTDGVSPDEFRSFPSGHTACAACSMLAILLPTLNKRLQGKERQCLLVAVGLTLLVAVTRIWMGAHFLSDVAVSWLIALGVSALGIRLFYFDPKFFNKLWGLFAPQPAPQKEDE